MRQIDYNPQRDNFNFAGKFSGYKQCFSTCAWMFISYYDKNCDGSDDQQLKVYVDDVEATVGKPGIGELIKQKYNWITGHTSYWGIVQESGIQKWLPSHTIIFDTKFPIDRLPDLVEKGPVIISTRKMGGLKGGHIILLVDNYYHDEIGHIGYYVNDPYGNAITNYINHNGENQVYTKNYLNKFINKGNDLCWVLYAG